jgi:hypothetical protein
MDRSTPRPARAGGTRRSLPDRLGRPAGQPAASRRPVEPCPGAVRRPGAPPRTPDRTTAPTTPTSRLDDARLDRDQQAVLGRDVQPMQNVHRVPTRLMGGERLGLLDRRIHCGGTFLSLLPRADRQSFRSSTQGKVSWSCVQHTRKSQLVVRRIAALLDEGPDDVIEGRPEIGDHVREGERQLRRRPPVPRIFFEHQYARGAHAHGRARGPSGIQRQQVTAGEGTAQGGARRGRRSRSGSRRRPSCPERDHRQ